MPRSTSHGRNPLFPFDARSTAWALAAVAITALVYLPTLANELVWDDRLDILANPAVHDVRRALGSFTHLQGIYYRPLILLSFAVEHSLWGDRALGFHLSNLILHAFNVFLLITIARRGGLPLFAAVLAGLLFGIHPLQTDAVAYVSGRTDVLMTTGALLAWRALQTRWTAGVRGVAAALAVGAAILSKDAGYAAVPCVAWWVFRHERSWSARMRVIVPSVLVGALLVLTRPGGMPMPAGALLPTSVSAVGQALHTYAGLLIWPSNLQIDRFTQLSAATASVAIGVLLVIVVGGAATWAISLRTVFADWVVWSLAFYLPVANIIALYPAVADRWLFTPEHNLYAPLAGIAVLIAGGVAGIDARAVGNWRLVVRGAAGALLVASALTTLARLRDWRDEESLFRSAVAAGSVSPRVWFNHANGLVRQNRLPDAIAAYRTAVTLAPHDVDAWTNLGVALQRSGDINAALDAYARSASLAPPSALLLENLGTAQLRLGDVGNARASFVRALELDPQRETARKALAAIDGGG